MDYTTLTTPAITVSEAMPSEFVAGSSLYEALQVLPDPRRGQGKRYELALLLCLLLLAKLAGQTTLKAHAMRNEIAPGVNNHGPGADSRRV